MPEPEKPSLTVRSIKSVSAWMGQLRTKARQYCFRAKLFFFASFAWMFSSSGKPHPTTAFYFWFGIPFSLLIWGAEMTSNYAVVRWLFFFAFVSAVGLMYHSLIVLLPFPRKFWTAIFALLMAVGLILFYAYLCPTVSINPKMAEFASYSNESSGFSQEYRFRVQNKTDNDLYSVVFKVKASGLTLNNFRFEIPKSSQFPLSDDPALRRIGDMAGMSCTDLKGRPVWWWRIAHLGPHDSREMILTQINPAAESAPPSAVIPPHVTPPTGKGVTVKATIVGFRQASGVMTKPGMQGDPIVLDETLKCGAENQEILDEPELGRRFPGGFVELAVLTSGSSTAGHTVKSVASNNLDVTWDSATITDTSATQLTVVLKGLAITRTEITPSGAQTAGPIRINGSAIWRIDRGSKQIVYVNNAISFWGYVLAGYVISDTDNQLEIAIGLQAAP